LNEALQESLSLHSYVPFQSGDLSLTKPSPRIIHLDDIDSVVAEREPPTEGAMVAHESLKERGEVLIFFRCHGGDARIGMHQSRVACLHFDNSNGSAVNEDDIRF
jgi:hypothetical protein